MALALAQFQLSTSRSHLPRQSGMMFDVSLVVGPSVKEGIYLVGGLVAIFGIFPYIGFLIIPIDFHIFQRGGPGPPTRYLLVILSDSSD